MRLTRSSKRGVLPFQRDLSRLTIAAGLLLSGWADAGQSSTFCNPDKERSLLIDGALSGRYLALAPGETQQWLDSNRLNVVRPVLHRTYSLFAEGTGRVSLVYGRKKGTALLRLDPSRKEALQVPVFFVGRQGESEDMLYNDACRLEFKPSQMLDTRDDFPAVRFQLRQGASLFSTIRPFFGCGQPGVIVCAGGCPADADNFAASLVTAVLSGEGSKDAKKCPDPTGDTAIRVPPPKQAEAVKDITPPPAPPVCPAPVTPPPEQKSATCPVPVPAVRLKKQTALFALVTTGVETRLDPPFDTSDFWMRALKLIADVSGERFDVKYLARAQSTVVLNPILDRKTESDPLEAAPAYATLLNDASCAWPGRSDAGPNVDVSSESKPVRTWNPACVWLPGDAGRFNLETGLAAVRAIADLDPVTTEGAETVILISSSIKRENSDFCEREVSGAEMTAKAQRQIRTGIVLEIWDDAVGAAAVSAGQAETVKGGPGGIYACSKTKTNGKFKVYGLSSTRLSAANKSDLDDSFSYLTQKARETIRQPQNLNASLTLPGTQGQPGRSPPRDSSDGTSGEEIAEPVKIGTE